MQTGKWQRLLNSSFRNTLDSVQMTTLEILLANFSYGEKFMEKIIQFINYTLITIEYIVYVYGENCIFSSDQLNTFPLPLFLGGLWGTTGNSRL